MKFAKNGSMLALFLGLALAGCGGGDGSSSGAGVGETGNTGGGNTGGGNTGGGNTGGGNTGGGNSTPRVMLRGVAALGSPMVEATIRVVGSANTRSVSAITDAEGRYSVDVTGLTPPLRVFANNPRTNELFATTSVAFEGETIANVNPATHAISLAMGDTPTLAKRNQLTSALQTSLDAYFRTYLVTGNAGNFFTDGNFVADGNGLDAVYDQVRIAFVGNGILLENRANPLLRNTIDTTVANPVGTRLDMATGNTDINPVTLRLLAEEINLALERPGNSPDKLANVLHPEFKDNNGLVASDWAALSTEIGLRIESQEVLRCFADTPTVQDRCLVRFWLRGTPTLNELDYGNPDVNNLELVAAEDLIIERRLSATPTGTSVGRLKVVGGQFHPYSAYLNLIHIAPLDVSANGDQTTAGPLKTFLQLDVGSREALADGTNREFPAAVANRNLRSVTLQQTINNVTTAILGVSRPGNGQCTGVLSMVINPVADANCGTLTEVADVGTLEARSRMGQVNLSASLSIAVGPVNFPVVRIKRGASINIANFAFLDRNSRLALHAYGRSNTPPTSLNINMSAPAGFSQVCIAANLNNLDDSVCVRSSRMVSIPNNLLPAGRAQYYLFSVDNEGHAFVRQYNLK